MGLPSGQAVAAVLGAPLLDADQASFVNAKQPWTPFLGNRPNEFTLADLVAYATG